MAKKRTADEIKAEISNLEAMAKARRGKPGFGENVAAIDARLAECREELKAANV